MKNKYTLQPSREPGFWVAIDQDHGIAITFREHEFNDTQKVSLLDGATIGSIDQATKIAGYLREIADWLRKEHYDTAMPSLHARREQIGQTIRSLRLQRELTQDQLAREAGITRPNLANIEAGKYSAGLDILNKIADALGVIFEIK